MHEVGCLGRLGLDRRCGPESPAAAAEGELVLASWKQMLDDGRMKTTITFARPRASQCSWLSADMLAGLGVSEGDEVRLL